MDRAKRNVFSVSPNGSIVLRLPRERKRTWRKQTVSFKAWSTLAREPHGGSLHVLSSRQTADTYLLFRAIRLRTSPSARDEIDRSWGSLFLRCSSILFDPLRSSSTLFDALRCSSILFDLALSRAVSKWSKRRKHRRRSVTVTSASLGMKLVLWK